MVSSAAGKSCVKAVLCDCDAGTGPVTGIGSVKETGQVAIENVKETHRHTEMMTGIVLTLVCMLC